MWKSNKAWLEPTPTSLWWWIECFLQSFSPLLPPPASYLLKTHSKYLVQIELRSPICIVAVSGEIFWLEPSNGPDPKIQLFHLLPRTQEAQFENQERSTTSSAAESRPVAWILHLRPLQSIENSREHASESACRVSCLFRVTGTLLTDRILVGKVVTTFTTSPNMPLKDFYVGHSAGKYA